MRPVRTDQRVNRASPINAPRRAQNSQPPEWPLAFNDLVSALQAEYRKLGRTAPAAW